MFKYFFQKLWTHGECHFRTRYFRDINIMKHVMVTICHATYQLCILNLMLIASLFNSYLTSMWAGLKNDGFWHIGIALQTESTYCLR